MMGFLLLITLLGAPIHCWALGSADFLDKQLAFNHKFKLVRHFDDTVLGYDNHTDRFYIERIKSEDGREKDLANNFFGRENLKKTKVIVSGLQNVQSIETAYPFVIGQRSLINEGVMSDRWDIKVDSLGQQYFGLYSGSDTYVTNRMRSHLIRWLANGIKDYLPILDRINEDLSEHSEKIFSELRGVIRRITIRLAKKIKGSIDDLIYFNEYDKSNDEEILVGGTMLVITKNYIILINMGNRQMLTYDSTGSLVDQTEEQVLRKESSFIHHGETIAGPYVKMMPRKFKGVDGNEHKIDYLVMQTAPTSEHNSVVDCINAIKDDNMERNHRFTEAMHKLVDSSIDRLNGHISDISFMVIEARS